MTRLIPVEIDTDAVWSALDKAGSTNTTTAALSTVNLVCAADLKPEPIRWLWPGWLPRGKLTILAGDGGTGKNNASNQHCSHYYYRRQMARPNPLRRCWEHHCLVE